MTVRLAFLAGFIGLFCTSPIASGAALPRCLLPKMNVDAWYAVYFEPHKAELSERARQILDAFVAQERRTPIPVVDMSAETDGAEVLPADKDLRLRRGEVVRFYLIERGIAPEWLFVDSSGYRPLRIPNERGVAEPENRRVALWSRSFDPQSEIDRGECVDWLARSCLAGSPERASSAQCEGALKWLRD